MPLATPSASRGQNHSLGAPATPKGGFEGPSPPSAWAGSRGMWLPDPRQILNSQSALLTIDAFMFTVNGLNLGGAWTLGRCLRMGPPGRDQIPSGCWAEAPQQGGHVGKEEPPVHFLPISACVLVLLSLSSLFFLSLAAPHPSPLPSYHVVPHRPCPANPPSYSDFRLKHCPVWDQEPPAGAQREASLPPPSLPKWLLSLLETNTELPHTD